MISSSMISHSRLREMLFSFLNLHYRPEFPVLLALSGGPDSLALFHLLLEYREQHSISFGVAHIDHGWRAESRGEARVLGNMASSQNIPFHLHTLDPKLLKGNLEAACRHERLQFFKSLCESCGYQAVLLGHQSDDVAETVFKKVCEGSSLPHLGALKSIARIGSLTLWRPFLNASKACIRSYLESIGAKPFEDSTNLDPRFLRARLRASLFPLLTREFGKEVGKSLCRLSEESHELEEFLQKLLNPAARVIKSSFGSLMQFHPGGASRFEIKYLLRKLCEEEECYFSFSLIEEAADLLVNGAANKQVAMGSKILEVDRNRAFLLRRALPILPLRQSLKEGIQNYAFWKVEVTRGEPFPNPSTGWQAAWQGHLQISLPDAEYEIGAGSLKTSYPRSSPISKWWTDAKVPAFLRHHIPVIWQGNRIAHEFLTGKVMAKSDCHVNIKLSSL